MTYKIKTSGFNYTNLDNLYIFNPLLTRAVITIIPKKSGILKFMLIQNKNIIKISIYDKVQRITIIDKIYNCIFNCKKDEKLIIFPHITYRSQCEIIIKNLTIDDKNDDKNNDKNDDKNNNVIIANTTTNITNYLTNEQGNQVVNLNNNFIIVTTQWGIKIAESLQNMLEELGYITSIIKDSISNEILTNNKTRPNEYFIILFSHLVPKMPESNKYIIYQLEQKRQSKFITQTVLNNISNSLIAWDYSNENIAQFAEPYKNKIVFQPISIIKKCQEYNLPIKYDILFFGSNCTRRKNILKYIKNKNYNIFITNKIFGDKLYKLITQSKIILNLHVYEDAILEVARLNEVLAFNKVIISELPCDEDNINKNFYQDKVIYCEVIQSNLSNINNLTYLIDLCLKPDYYNSIITNNKNNIDKIYLNSIEHLKENLKIIIDIYKIYISKSQIYKYAELTDTIWGKKINHIVRHVLINKNHFDVDTHFYSQINNLENMDENALFKHIKEQGIESGLIYHPKQLKNIFTDIEIFTNSKNNIFIKKDNKYIECNKYINDELYKKDFEWYMNQVEEIENKLLDCDLLLLVFIGNLEIGIQLINKIILYKNVENFSLGVCFRTRELFENMNEKIKENFNNYGIFISKEYGNDIVPTLLMYNKIKSVIQFSKIIKLHTKTSDKTWFNELSDFLLRGKINDLNQHSKSNCNCIGLEKYYHKDSNPLSNIKILDKYKSYIDKEYFVRGTMFFCDTTVFINIFEIIKLDYRMFLNNNLYDNNSINFVNSPIHALERLFGVIKV
jgi:hypothetical protein